MILYRVTLLAATATDVRVHVLWNFDARTGSPANEAIRTLLTTVEGVNVVDLRRYDATLTIAPWMIGPINFFMVELLEQLYDDREIPVALGMPAEVPDVIYDGWDAPTWWDLYAPR